MVDIVQPVHIRLREMIADAIIDGTYGEGDMLPSVRSLAQREQANPLTVAKAYQHFQDEGYVIVQRGVGMFVAKGAADRLRVSMRHRFLSHEWPRIRSRMATLGIAVGDLDLEMSGDVTRPSKKGFVDST